MLLNASAKNCDQVREFLSRSVRPVLDREVNALPYRRICRELFLRVQAWLQSVAKLNDPADFQAASAASRSIYETAVTMVLIHHEERQSVRKLMTWEESCKLKYAERRNSTKPEEHTRTFIKRNSARILADREATWGRNRHGKPNCPDRWTGRNLEADAKKADQYASAGFVRFYNENYTQTCWYVHGTGVVGFLDIPHDRFPLLCGLALHDVSSFSQVCAEYALRLFNRFDAISEERLKLLRDQLGDAADVTLLRAWEGEP